MDSLHAWKVFATAYPEEDQEETLRYRRQVIIDPNMPLAEYVKPITSSTFGWITFLDLSFITCSRLDLINISTLVNLGVLTIGRSVETFETGLDDRIVRAWSRAATESGAFGMLRVLACRSQLDLTVQCFHYISQFPSLALFVVENCAIGSQDKPHAQALGWRYRSGKGLSALLAEGGCKIGSWIDIIRACFYKSRELGVQEMVSKGVNAIDSLPVLHFSLGPALADATVDRTVLQCIRYFQRDTHQASEETRSAARGKRKLADSMRDQPVRKRVVNASRKQDFENSLVAFGI